MHKQMKTELIKEAQKGDMASFTCLFEHLRPALYAKALLYFGYSPEAKDVLHESFITAFSKIHQLKDPCKFNTWIHTILKNKCLLIQRDQLKFCFSEKLPQLSSDPLHAIPSIEEGMIAEGNENHLLEMLSHLDEEKRVAILLRFYSDFNSYKEIANILNIPPGTVKSRLANAKKELKTYLDCSQGSTSGNLAADDRGIQTAWTDFYEGNRSRFLSLFEKDLQIRFSSGKMESGLKRWAAEWDIDLLTGVRFKPNYIISSGNLTLVEGPIINPPDKPEQCPPEGGFVFFHHKKKIHKIHAHYASRKKVLRK
ncbi:MAG: RNA polymerase sigma factor [Cyclobacterium sp.]|uniref:RNA polymerase sigma factor n=1 Tax=Cyclobacterium sp. TaxID=1966343 RepID=UPI003970F05A